MKTAKELNSSLRVPKQIREVIGYTHVLSGRCIVEGSRYYKLPHGVGVKVTEQERGLKEFEVLCLLKNSGLAPKPYCFKPIKCKASYYHPHCYGIFMEHIVGTSNMRAEEVDEIWLKLNDLGVNHIDLEFGHNCKKTKDGRVFAFDFEVPHLCKVNWRKLRAKTT